MVGKKNKSSVKDRVALTWARVDVEDHVMEKGCN